MSDNLVVRTDTHTWKFPLRKASLPLGNDPRLELNVPHSELIARAATIDNRGECPLIVNHNPFPIYVGQEKVESGGCTNWNLGAIVQLTRSISLEFHGAGGRQDLTATSPVTRGSGSLLEQRNLIQICVTLLCCVLGVSMMTRADESRPVIHVASFAELLQSVSRYRKLSPERAEKCESLISALQDAHITEVRWRRLDPQRVVQAYNRLLQEEVVRMPAKAEADLAAKITLYGSERIQSLWQQMNYH